MSGLATAEKPHERILVVEDHGLVAEGLAAGLRQAGHTVAVLQVDDDADESTLADRVAEVAESFRPSLCLLDIDLGGIESIPLIPVVNDFGVRVVMLTGHTDPLVHARCVEAGAAGVVQKSVRFNELLRAISTLVSGLPLIDGHTRSELLLVLRRERRAVAERHAPFKALTLAEAEVMRGLIDGLTPTQIARRRVVTVATVRSQIHRILTRLGASGQLEAVAMARRVGWPPS